MNPLVSAGAGMVWHAIRRTLSVICVLAVAGAIAWSVYVAFIKPHTNPTEVKKQIQQAESITNVENNFNEPDKAFFLGIKLFGIRLGLSK